MSEPGAAVILSAGAPGRSRSLSSDAWRSLRRNPVGIVSGVLILVLLAMAVAPGLFTRTDPSYCSLPLSLQPPGPNARFGLDQLGCDVYSRTVHGARASILVGVLATLVALLVGGSIGLLAGYFGGWLDALLSRAVDVFFAIPVLLGAILAAVAFPNDPSTTVAESLLKVSLVIAALGWPTTARVMRASVIQTSRADYVEAAKALGAGHVRILLRHVLPNAVGPALVVATISMGGYIGAEATLSYLGVGLVPGAYSWGLAIDSGSNLLRVAPNLVVFPAIFLSVTVLAFLMLGDAVRDAFDPKRR